MSIMVQPGEGLTPQPGGPEVVPVASLRLKEHYRPLLTGSVVPLASGRP